MRAFVIMRRAIVSDNARIFKLENKVEKLSNYIEEILVNQNDINEQTRMQLDALSFCIQRLTGRFRFPHEGIFTPSPESLNFPVGEVFYTLARDA